MYNRRKTNESCVDIYDFLTAMIQTCTVNTTAMMSLAKFSMFLVPAMSMMTGSLARAAEIDFGRDIRPILSDNCFLCHGPAAETREADLRLDDPLEAHQYGVFDGESGAFLERILADDATEVMPPPDSGKSLTERQRQLLAEWVRSGAKYTDHWAFVPPVRPAVPQLQDSDWPQNPIDNFIAYRNQQRDVPQAPRASRRTLVRRLYLDLTGLPPTPDQLTEVLEDPSPAAVERLIQRLLESKHFGERWARWWLDAARYSDSDGYEKDKPRSVWFYRDWVINAMNQNMPFDQFVIEQIAGDLLPGAGQSQRVATGFLRNSMVNEEGGADPEQFRVEGMFDRLDAIGKAVLGITTQCAQCHTHKYDPLSQREYYQMFAALNDCHEAMISVFTPEQAQQRDQTLAEVERLEAELKASKPDWQQRFNQWILQAESQLISWQTQVPSDLPFEGQKFRLLGDGSIISESYAPTKASNTFSLTTRLGRITAFRLDALTHPQLPRGGPGRSLLGTGALTEFEVRIAAQDGSGKQQVKFVRAYSDANPPKTRLPDVYRDRDPEKDQRVTGGIEMAIDDDAQTAWSTDVGPGRRNRNRVAIFVPESPVEVAGDVTLSFTLKQNHGGWNSDDNQNYLLGRYRFSTTDQALPERFLPSEIEAILRLPEGQRTASQVGELFSYWRTTQPEFEEVNSQIAQVWQDFPETASQLVVQSTRKPRESFVFARGDFLKPLEAVPPGGPAILGKWQESDQPPRLQFAQWLVRPDSPTTARMIVNRIWQAYFGNGIVVTPEDFGFQGAPPTHPDLLDWLAVELMESGWNLKHVHRLITNSATYQQASRLTEGLASADPANSWLARGPRFRVDAETVRDIALTAAGILNDRVGGRSVYPPAPDFLFQPPASYGPKVWHTESSDQQYRRSLYIHSYRSVPYPTMQVFDAPKGDAACIRRERSNTPLQALVMLNEDQFIQCARAMAARLLREAGPADAHRIDYAFVLTVGRPPHQRELEIVTEQLNQQRQRISTGDVDVTDLVGMSPLMCRQMTGHSVDELAAWLVVSRILLNLDETITKQ